MRRTAWELPVGPGLVATAKADQLAGILRTLPERVLSPAERERWAPALAEAGRLAAHLSSTRDRAREVLCHGDPHPGNALLVPGTSGATAAYRLVDPDGIVTEREYDVGVALRDFSRELLAAPTAADARALHAGLCRQAAAATGTDPERVGQWSLVERVTTGLYLRWFHDDETAATFLDSALLLLQG
ncbi:phosphotransferase [Pedococcus sp. NPDC057267]|uniref:phosphotransferase n=1 Tax=Pedococcus sp. NPDC057267 TaxID=3346077 RepID=UPI0036302E88